VNEEQYKLISARRNAFNQLIWQVPTLATASQAFLLAASLNPLIAPTTSLILACFSLVVGLASIQLMAKHRHLEMVDSELLSQFEKQNAESGYEVLHGRLRPLNEVPSNGFVRTSSFRIWIVVLGGFCALALFAGCLALTRMDSSAANPMVSQPAKQPVRGGGNSP